MAETPPIGPSTVIVWFTAAAIAVLSVLNDGGNWMLAVSAGLVAVNNALRSWQAHAPDIYVVGDGTGEHEETEY